MAQIDPNYQLLARLQQDCKYYLGYGQRAKKHLWAGDEAAQIKKMRELYAGLLEKPEWITLEEIAQYEAAMVTESAPTSGTLALDDGKENHVTEILQHGISWFLRGANAPDELDECSVEHIETLIKDGYHQGELCVMSADGETEYRGWWSIRTV